MLKKPKTIEQERKDFLIPILRKASVRWKYRLIAKEKARRVSQSSNKRLKWEFQCACCSQWFDNQGVELDHVQSISSWESWESFIEKLFCDESNYQVLCKHDHLAKSKKENEERVEIRKANKPVVEKKTKKNVRKT